MNKLHPDRLLPLDPATRKIARSLYKKVKDLPIISPHGHTDPSWFAENKAFTNAAALLVIPDHYVLRMLYSQGVSMEALGIISKEGNQASTDPREVWRLFAKHYYCFRGTPSRIWMDYVLFEVFGITEALSEKTADLIYDSINACLSRPEFFPRALFERFNIEAIATTESPLDNLKHHKVIAESGWGGKVITAFRPDPVVDPEFEGFVENVKKLGELTQLDTSSYQTYLEALRQRRRFFIDHGATSTDHGHPTAATTDIGAEQATALFEKILTGSFTAEEAELFRAQMLTEMAAMSVEDGLVMQLHPGSFRNHNTHLFENFGRDKGADIPTSIEYVNALRPLLNRFGNRKDFTLILFTLDETNYSRELAPLAGHYPCLKLGPAWWFHDSPEGMRRYRQQVTETAGFYNTVGFNDDTRAFLSIPARHDVARRIDCSYLAELVADHRLSEEEAAELAYDLSYRLAKEAYKL